MFNERVEFEEGISGENEDAAVGSIRVNIVASEGVAEMTEARSEVVEATEEEKTTETASTEDQIGAKEMIDVDAEEGIACQDVQQDRLVHETKNVNLGRVITSMSNRPSCPSIYSHAARFFQLAPFPPSGHPTCVNA